MADSPDIPTLPNFHSRRVALAGIAGGLAAATAAVAGVAAATTADANDDTQPLSLAQWASQPFEAVDVYPLLKKLNDPHVGTWMVAAMVLRCSKDELVEKLPGLSNLHFDFDFMTALEDSRGYFQLLADNCQAARLRIAIAGAVTDLSEGAQS